jgi:fumarate reductase flavoprotein subunit
LIFWRALSMKHDFDVIVIGGGGAGLAAAVTAAQRGSKVLVVEAGAQLGGSTALSTGVFLAAGTKIQSARGVDDNADAMFQYCMLLNQYRADAALVRRLCDNSAPALEWLMSLGVEYLPEHLYASGADLVPRGHRPVEYGAGLVAALDQKASNLGVQYAMKTRVRRILWENARVSGIHVDGEDIRSGAVVIATGGFGNSREHVARYYPDAAAGGDMTYHIGNQHSRGDGLELGQSVGASLAGFNCGLIEVTPGFSREPESYLPPWLIFVNRDGRRFVRESASYAVMSGVVKAQLGGEAIVMFDEAARKTAKVVNAYKPLFANWVPERLAEFARDGKLTVSDTIDELAETIGIKANTLRTTIETYNHDCDCGVDTRFHKDPAQMKPIRTPPFYAARIRPAVLMVTCTGLRIDRDARVLDDADRPIAGLYAAGETTGGVIAERYYGGGASMASNIVFGRLAGDGAAAFALEI